MSACVIYMVTSPSNRIYIGQSRNVKKRFEQYRKLNCKTQSVLINSFLKYGVDNHVFEIIEECDLSEMNIRERYWQEYHNSLAPNGLNSMLTETNVKTRTVSKETSRKLSESKLGAKNPMYGTKKSDEEKKNLSNKFKGRVFTTEWIAKINESKRASGKHKQRTISDSNRKLLNEAILEKASGFNNPRSRIVLDIQSGIFYYNVKDVSMYNNINENNLRAMLIGKIKNNTSFIFA